MSLEIYIFLALEDNYGYLVHDKQSGKTASIDAADEGAIIKALKHTGWNLSDIFITHHHWDHIDAILELKEKFDIVVSGPKFESDKISGLDRLLVAGDRIKLGASEFEIINLRGHTNGHIGYYDKKGGHLFVGDALFSLGCGRMFEGTPEQMWGDLNALNNLPDDVLIYCGHEYSLSNAAFARHIDPNNEMLKQRQKEIKAQLANGEFTIPVTLGAEKATNPFLRCNNSEIAKAVGKEGASAVDVFAAVRKAKDVFRG